MSDELLTLQELAAALKIGLRKANQLKAEGMPRIPITPTTVRYRLNDVIAWCAERTNEKAAV